MAVITNPLYFTTLLVLIVSAYFVNRFGLSGPLIQVIGTVYKEVHRQVVEKLREAFAQEPEPQRVAVREPGYPVEQGLGSDLMVSRRARAFEHGGGREGGRKKPELTFDLVFRSQDGESLEK